MPKKTIEKTSFVITIINLLMFFSINKTSSFYETASFVLVIIAPYLIVKYNKEITKNIWWMFLNPTMHAKTKTKADFIMIIGIAFLSVIFLFLLTMVWLCYC